MLEHNSGLNGASSILQSSVVKWKEYTAQFQASEPTFQTQMPEATVNLKRSQRRLGIAKRRVDAESEDKEDGHLGRQRGRA